MFAKGQSLPSQSITGSKNVAAFTLKLATPEEWNSLITWREYLFNPAENSESPSSIQVADAPYGVSAVPPWVRRRYRERALEKSRKGLKKASKDPEF